VDGSVRCVREHSEQDRGGGAAAPLAQRALRARGARTGDRYESARDLPTSVYVGGSNRRGRSRTRGARARGAGNLLARTCPRSAVRPGLGRSSSGAWLTAGLARSVGRRPAQVRAAPPWARHAVACAVAAARRGRPRDRERVDALHDGTAVQLQLAWRLPSVASTAGKRKHVCRHVSKRSRCGRVRTKCPPGRRLPNGVSRSRGTTSGATLVARLAPTAPLALATADSEAADEGAGGRARRAGRGGGAADASLSRSWRESTMRPWMRPKLWGCATEFH
jgi:hypothetical protein